MSTGTVVERQRGDGRIFKPRNKEGKELRFWRIAYWGIRPDGSSGECRESSHSTDRRVAEKMLRDRLRRVENHRQGVEQFIAPKRTRVTVAELLTDMEKDYEIRGLASLRTARAHAAHLREFFGFDLASSITTSRLRAYIEHRQKEKPAPASATIDREMEKLSRALRMAVGDRKLPFMPTFPERLVPVHSNAREGFVEAATFRLVLAKIEEEDADVADFAEWLFLTGMRRSEALRLTWEAFDRQEWTLRLPARSAKTKKPRAFALEGDFLAVIKRRLAVRCTDQSHIFYRRAVRGRGRGQDAQRLAMGDFSKLWRSACKAAGVPGLLLHDLRRSAVRNLIRAGVSQSVAMAISGHATDSMFKRYNVTDAGDLREAALRVTAYRAEMEREGSKVRAIAG